ncbi:MAG TPA: DUF222 domain-containing protein [Acidimicrobiales bacterium]
MPPDQPLHSQAVPVGDAGIGPGGVTARQSAAGASPPTDRGPRRGAGGVVRTRADEVESQLCELAALINAANAELMALLAEFDRLEGWQGTGIRSIGHWAAIHLGIDARTAARQTIAGHRLSELPAIAGACAGGEIGWSKVRVLAQVAEPATDERWLGLARDMSVTQLTRCAHAYRRACDTDDRERLERARERRGIWLFDEPDGLVRITGLLEPDDAAVLRAALSAQEELQWRDRAAAVEVNETDAPDTADTAAAEPAAAAGTQGTDAAADTAAPEPDDSDASDRPRGDEAADTDADGSAEEEHHVARPTEVDPTLAARDPAATRRADALIALARVGLSAGEVPDDGDDLTHVVLHADVSLFEPGNQVARSHLAHGSAVSTATAQRLACAPVVQALLERKGVPLAMGRSQRLVNRAQRRALRARDGGCAFPGCAATRHLHAHHIVHWTQGGATDLENLVLLCRHHHRLLHEGGYAIRLTGGRPVFHRPDGTPIRPPRARDRRCDGHLPVPALRQRTRTAGHRVTQHTPRARSGGAPHWSPQRAIDALTSGPVATSRGP